MRNGQAQLARVRPEADAATRRFGVPGPVLVAVWGMELNTSAAVVPAPSMHFYRRQPLLYLSWCGRRREVYS